MSHSRLLIALQLSISRLLCSQHVYLILFSLRDARRPYFMFSYLSRSDLVHLVEVCVVVLLYLCCVRVRLFI
jgi:hypothetical protein